MVATYSARFGLGDPYSGPIRDALELLAAARRSGLGGAIECLALIDGALQPAGHLAQNVDMGVAHIER